MDCLQLERAELRMDRTLRLLAWALRGRQGQKKVRSGGREKDDEL